MNEKATSGDIGLYTPYPLKRHPGNNRMIMPVPDFIAVTGIDISYDKRFFSNEYFENGDYNGMGRDLKEQFEREYSVTYEGELLMYMHTSGVMKALAILAADKVTPRHLRRRTCAVRTEAQKLTETEAANAIIPDLDREIVRAVISFIEKRGISVQSYRYYESNVRQKLGNKSAQDISKTGFIIGNGEKQLIFCNQDSPAHEKCKTLLHELIHATTGNYLFDPTDKQASRDMEKATSSAADYLYSNSILERLFNMLATASIRQEAQYAIL